MSEIKIPYWFWVSAALLLIWNLLGVFNFYLQITLSDEAIQALPDSQQAFYDNFPIWAKMAFALAVLAGSVGSLALLLKNKMAKVFFILSLAGIIIQMLHNLSIANKINAHVQQILVMSTVLIVISIFAIWLSLYAKSKAWIK